MKKLLTLLFLTAFALVGYAEVVASGYCGGEGDGTNLKWELTDAGTLTICGTGIMGDYTSTYEKPWYNYRTEIEDVSLQEGVTSIGSSAFRGCAALTSVVIPEEVTSIGDCTFYDCGSLTSITSLNLVPPKCGKYTECTFLVFINLYLCMYLKKA